MESERDMDWSDIMRDVYEPTEMDTSLISIPEALFNWWPLSNVNLAFSSGVSLEKLTTLESRQHAQHRCPTETNSSVPLKLFDSSWHVKTSFKFLFMYWLVYFCFSPAGPTCIYYGFQFGVFYEIPECENECVYASLSVSWAFSSAPFILFVCFVLFWCVSLCLFHFIVIP